MTLPEMLVWSSAFTQALNDRRAQNYYVVKRETPEMMQAYACARAAEAVEALRDAKSIFKRNDKHPDCGIRLIPTELELLLEMTTTDDLPNTPQLNIALTKDG